MLLNTHAPQVTSTHLSFHFAEWVVGELPVTLFPVTGVCLAGQAL